MGTAWCDKKPWPFDDQLFAACLTAAIVVTAKANDNQVIVLLGFINHRCECFTH
jgi:hypothetical protein